MQREKKTTLSIVSGITYVHDDSEDPSESSTAKSSPQPSPTNFDTFIPWVCSQWCASTAVVVTRLQQEEIVRKKHRKSRQKSRALSRYSMEDQLKTLFHSQGSVKGLDVMGDDVVPIKAYYNSINQLVEVSIIGCPKISRRVIQACNLSFSCHPMLNRLTIRRGGLNCELIYEIYKLIPHSNLTDICFDDSYVPEGNYYILLEQTSQLKSLSLNRCEINDEVCMKIAINLEHGCPAANTLQTLGLASNNITDSGARSLAEMLKLNRCLLHLNLSGNTITDVGSIAILNTLKEFQLTSVECADMHRRMFEYLQNKMAVYEQCLEEIMHCKSDEVDSSASSARKKVTHTSSSKNKHRKCKRMALRENTVKNQAEHMARCIVGEFCDPYSSDQVVIKEGVYYAKGNLKLCSLNMAYNDLGYASVRKLYEVVLYQDNFDKMEPDTGLMRVTLDGNWIPKSCMELDVIDVCLTKVIADRAPTPRRTRVSSSLRRLIPKREATSVKISP